MTKVRSFCVAPFKRRNGQLLSQEVIACATEDAAFKRGKAMMHRMDGLVFFKIECGEDGDIWTAVETLATVGDVPQEAEEAA
ncbi:hypothetical protein [Brevundimonas sp.]|uniref:hypothetical protein n=1 Tax=Brevundimonas sp. TaxID=1871086 RepID=UPI0028AFFAA1|nr:hypothetical protein [Brevundimonas sp.]